MMDSSKYTQKLSADVEMIKLAGGFAFEPVQFLDVARCDLGKAFQKGLEGFEVPFDDDANPAILQVLDKSADGIIAR